MHPASDTRIAYRECASLAEAGYEVVLIAAGEAPALPAGVRLRSVPLPKNRVDRMTHTIWNVYKAALDERADVYHFHDPELMGVGLALRARGAQVVFDVHEDIPQDIVDKPWIPGALRRPLSVTSALFLRAMHRWYSAIVTATPAIARRFPHRRTVVVANYPRIEELPQGGNDDFATRPRAAIYLGAITELRCIEEMMAALTSPALSPDIHLRLAGHFESAALETRVRAMPGWQQTEFLGFCRRADVAAAFSGARVGLLLFRPAANHEEAMPTKLFEYLGAGLPVVISDTLRCSQIVRDYDCGIVVKPSDIDGIARAITFLVENPAIAQAMGERGRRIVTERYQWTSEANKLKQLYAEIA
ncbi:MAG TPA: glycosyltransferase family 4 protein [Candidatus Baltobacteraceae bacterium]|nr:glycosyltransferase family 4 protein [Candidatus Baltobacteraceae bacterium]